MNTVTTLAHQVHGLGLSHMNYTPPSGGAQPPGVGKIDTIVQWVMWGVAAIMFVLFIVGLVKAAGARRNGGDADVSAPLWPLIAAIVLGGSSAIWKAISG